MSQHLQNYEKDKMYKLRDRLGNIDHAFADASFVPPSAILQVALANLLLGEENRFEGDLVPDVLLLQVEYGRESVVSRRVVPEHLRLRLLAAVVEEYFLVKQVAVLQYHVFPFDVATLLVVVEVNHELLLLLVLTHYRPWPVEAVAEQRQDEFVVYGDGVIRSPLLSRLGAGAGLTPEKLVLVSEDRVEDGFEPGLLGRRRFRHAQIPVAS